MPCACEMQTVFLLVIILILKIEYLDISLETTCSILLISYTEHHIPPSGFCLVFPPVGPAIGSPLICLFL